MTEMPRNKELFKKPFSSNNQVNKINQDDNNDYYLARLHSNNSSSDNIINNNHFHKSNYSNSTDLCSASDKLIKSNSKIRIANVSDSEHCNGGPLSPHSSLLTPNKSFTSADVEGKKLSSFQSIPSFLNRDFTSFAPRSSK